MKKIRQQVFETNSSSTHSISISDVDPNMLMGTLPLVDGNVVLEGGRFGWDQETFHDSQSKASYLAIYIQSWVPNEEQKQRFKDLFEKVIQEQTGCQGIVYNFSTDWNVEGKSWSYIDHQSVENQEYHYLFEDKNLLRNFIFNDNSYLKTDNDNHYD